MSLIAARGLDDHEAGGDRGKIATKIAGLGLGVGEGRGLSEVVGLRRGLDST